VEASYSKNKDKSAKLKNRNKCAIRIENEGSNTIDPKFN
jgi:hypothetical protein